VSSYQTTLGPFIFRSAQKSLSTLRQRTVTSAHVKASADISGNPLVRKLGIKPEARLGLIGAPEGFDDTLGEFPPGVHVRRRLGGEPFDVLVAFHSRRADLERRLPALGRALDPAGGLWLAWPKRASALATDLTDDVVRRLGLAAGLVDNKVCAIDAVWSGLRLVYRRRDRPGSDPRAAESA
jgi:hypothetical protein